ncbi:MAG TPA: C2H2-type zinc finger protein [Chloroflexota bacterium]|nr:C2H2-type zinc finger protein [Chloroflexota bacterium]
METPGPPGDFRCPRCEAQFPTWQELDDHRRAAHLTPEPGGIRCSTCGEQFESAPARDEHEREAHVVPVEDGTGRRA